MKTAPIAGFLLSFLMGSAALADGFSAGIWTIDEYNRENPGHASRAEAFGRVVQASEPPLFSPGDSESGQKAVRISVIYPGKQISDYWKRSVDSLKGRLDQAGLSYTVTSSFTEAGTEIRLQEKLLRDSLRESPDYLVFTLDALRHKKIIENILSRSQTKIILQNITTPVRAWGDQQPFLYVGFDHEKGSKFLADEYIKRTNGAGKYAVFFGPRGYVSYMRGNYFIEYVSRKSDLQFTSGYYVGFDREKAREAALELVEREKDLSFIYACSTDIALGIADALKEKGLTGKILVNGWGGGGSELSAIEDGALSFTVMRINDDNGVAMADAILLDQDGQGGDLPLVFSGEMALVDQSMTGDRIQDLKEKSFRYSGM